MSVLPWANLRNQPQLIAAGVILTEKVIKATKTILLENMKILSAALIAGGLVVLLPALAVSIVNIVGFTSGGVFAGSLAAAIQSAIYGGFTGGVFSTLQSFSATAIMPPPVIIGVGVAALVVRGWYLAYQQFKTRKHSTARRYADAETHGQVIAGNTLNSNITSADHRTVRLVSRQILLGERRQLESGIPTQLSQLEDRLR